MSDTWASAEGPKRAIYGPGAKSANYSIAARTPNWTDIEAENATTVLQGINFNTPVEGGFATVDHPSFGHLVFRYRTADSRDVAGRQYLLEEVTALSKEEFLQLRGNPYRIQFDPLLEPSQPVLDLPQLPRPTSADDADRLEQLLRSRKVDHDRVMEVLAGLLEAGRVVVPELLTPHEVELLILLLPVPLRFALTFQSPIHQPSESSRVPRLLMVPRGRLFGYQALVVDAEQGLGADDEMRKQAGVLLRLANDSSGWVGLLDEFADVRAPAAGFGLVIADLLLEAQMRRAQAQGDAQAMFGLLARARAEDRTEVAERILRDFPPTSVIAVLQAELEADRQKPDLAAIESILACVCRHTQHNPTEQAIRESLWRTRDRWAGEHAAGGSLLRMFLLYEALRKGEAAEAVRMGLGRLRPHTLPAPHQLGPGVESLGGALLKPGRGDVREVLHALAETQDWPDSTEACRVVADWSGTLLLHDPGFQSLDGAFSLLESCEPVWDAMLRAGAKRIECSHAAADVLGLLGVAFAPRADWLGGESAGTLVRGVVAALEQGTDSVSARWKRAVVLAGLLLQRVASGRAPASAVASSLALIRQAAEWDGNAPQFASELLKYPKLAMLLVAHGDSLSGVDSSLRHAVFVQGLCERMASVQDPQDDGSELVSYCGRMVRERIYLRADDFQGESGSMLRNSLTGLVTILRRRYDGDAALRWVYANIALATEPAAASALQMEFIKAAENVGGAVLLWLLSRSLGEVDRAREIGSYDQIVALHEAEVRKETNFSGADREALQAFTGVSGERSRSFLPWGRPGRRNE